MLQTTTTLIFLFTKDNQKQFQVHHTQHDTKLTLNSVNSAPQETSHRVTVTTKNDISNVRQLCTVYQCVFVNQMHTSKTFYRFPLGQTSQTRFYTTMYMQKDLTF